MGCLKLHITEHKLLPDTTPSSPWKQNFKDSKNNLSLCRSFYKTCTGSYRFSFNGMEKDDEVKGTGNSLDFGARIYDPRTGKFLSIDPKFAEYPFQSTYCFATDNPILYIDKEGEGPLLGLIGSVAGGVKEMAAQTISNGYQNANAGKGFFKNWSKNMDWVDVGISSAEWGVAGLTNGASLVAGGIVAGALRASVDYKPIEGNIKVAFGNSKYKKDNKEFLLDLTGEAIGLVGGKLTGTDAITKDVFTGVINKTGFVPYTLISGVFNGIGKYGKDELKNALLSKNSIDVENVVSKRQVHVRLKASQISFENGEMVHKDDEIGEIVESLPEFEFIEKRVK